MKKRIIDRYARNAAGELMIDITAERVEDLYDDYDKRSPYHKKELYQGLVDYISDSVSEIGKERFVIRFIFSERLDGELTARVKKSFQNYFLYLRELEYRELGRMSRTSLILFVIGVSFLSLSVWVNRIIGADDTVIYRVFAEGLTVAAWVSLWESLATFLINWVPHRRDIRLFGRIASAHLEFQVHSE